MLGYTASNSDVFVFLEPGEIAHLAKGKITGTYVNVTKGWEFGVLELKIDGIFCNQQGERIVTEREQSDDCVVSNMGVFIRNEIYEKVKDTGSVGIHQGFRHVNIDDVKRLNFGDALTYRQLRMFVDKNKNI